MKFLKNFLILILLTETGSAQTIYAYDHWAFEEIRNYLDTMLDNYQPPVNPEACAGVYAPAIRKGVMDIRYALGYFDESTGSELIWNNTNYGISPSLDPAIFFVLRRALTEPCYEDRELCGFYESGDANSGKLIFEKDIQLLGNIVTARITLTQGSASESYVLNQNSLRRKQEYLTYQSENNFFGGLEEADYVFYNGHSRNGGGPDFSPPILDLNNQTDYNGYYLVQKPGLNKMLRSIPRNPNQKALLGMFSCYSHTKFYDTLRAKFPNLRMILSINTINYFDALNGSIGYLEGMLQGRCGDDLSRTARRTPGVKNGFRDYKIN